MLEIVSKVTDLENVLHGFSHHENELPENEYLAVQKW